MSCNAGIRKERHFMGTGDVHRAPIEGLDKGDQDDDNYHPPAGSIRAGSVRAPAEPFHDC